MKLKELESRLQDLAGFSDPKITLEQYETQPHLAARTLYTIEQSYGDLSGKRVADLGCGPGRLSIGAALLEADIVYGFDVDPSALEIFQQNCSDAEVFNSECILIDVLNVGSPGSSSQKFHAFFDTVLLNPPFGTKGNKGIDIQFLLAGLNLSNHVVYSFHKSATRDYLLSKAKEWNVLMDVIAELKFDLPQLYKRHKRASIDVQVDVIRTVHVSKQ